MSSQSGPCQSFVAKARTEVAWRGVKGAVAQGVVKTLGTDQPPGTDQFPRARRSKGIQICGTGAT